MDKTTKVADSWLDDTLPLERRRALLDDAIAAMKARREDGARPGAQQEGAAREGPSKVSARKQAREKLGKLFRR